MKYVLLLIFVCHGALTEDYNDFKYPIPLKTKIYQPEKDINDIEVTWNAVKDWNQEDPIVGYQLAVWEMETVNKSSNGTTDDEEYRYPAKGPTLYKVPTDKRRVIIQNIKLDVMYYMAAFAFTKKEEGPLSSSTGIKVSSKRPVF